MLDRVDSLLSRISLIPLDQQVLTAAETLTPPSVAALDAVHLATAVRLAKDGKLGVLLTYDRRLADGAKEHGIEVLSPS